LRFEAAILELEIPLTQVIDSMARTLTLPGGSDLPRWLQLPFVRQLLLLGMAGILGLTAGVLGSTGRPELTLIFIGLAIAASIVSSRTALFWFLVIAALVVTGVSQLYLPGARYVRYVVPLASVALVLHLVTDYFNARTRVHDEPLPVPMLWAFAFALSVVVSLLVNLGSAEVAILGIRQYFQMWVFFLGVAFLRWNATFARNLLWGLLVLALLQLPFAAHQYLYLVPFRKSFVSEGVVPVDVVAGTFGAALTGGGATAVLAAFQIIVVGLLLALWKNGAMSTLKTAVLSALLLMPMLVNQAKVSVLYVLLMFVVVFYRDIIVRPGKFLMAGIAVAGLASLMMTALVLTNPTGRLGSWGDLVNYVVTQQTKSIEERQHEHTQLTRFTVLTFWASEHANANPVHTLLGHGPGASRKAEGALQVTPTLAVKRYPNLEIGLTAVSSLLWDTGIVGLITVLGMFASAFFTAGALARRYRGRDRVRTAIFEGLQAAMAVLTLSLAHKEYFVVNLPYQTLVYLLIGFIANSWLQVVRAESAAHAHRRL
jgi:hypothetical protein